MLDLKQSALDNHNFKKNFNLKKQALIKYLK